MADLSQVKVGDVIAIHNRNLWDKSCLLFLSTVERLTKTQVVCSDGRRFFKKNGSLIGGWSHGFIPTPEQLEGERLYRIEYKRKHDALIWLRKNIINNVDSLTVEQIEAMRAAYVLHINQP